MAGIGLRDALEQAGLHAFRIRAAREAPKDIFVELQIMPMGVEVGAWGHGVQLERVRRLIGWDVIEHTTFNVLISTIDELVEKLKN
jgi:hypothetical protein